MNKSRKRTITWIGLLLGVLALIAGGLLLYRSTRRPPAFVELRARALRQTIVSSGQVMPPAEVRLDSMLTSTVKSIVKREGDRVQAGEVLIELDQSEIEASLAQAEAAVQQARAGKSGLYSTTLPQANEALAQVRSNLAVARRELERERQLFESQVTTRSSLEKAENNVRIYESQEKATLSQVQAASAGGSSNLSASAALALAQAQLAAIKVTRDRARIVSPVDGVISSRLVEVGEVVRPGSSLLVVTAVGKTRVMLEPDERNLALLSLGQKATISAEAFPSESFEGRLGYIAPAVNGDRGTIEVRLDVAAPPAYLRPNMTVSVELEIATREDTLVIPLGVVQDPSTGHPWIGVLGERNRVERREIRLGLKGDDAVEILDGAHAGERVVTDPVALKAIAQEASR